MYGKRCALTPVPTPRARRAVPLTAPVEHLFEIADDMLPDVFGKCAFEK
jgi:hypothetical protein